MAGAMGGCLVAHHSSHLDPALYQDMLLNAIVYEEA